MTGELSALIITAVCVAFLHTILGPDHYLPFVMLSWARKWSAAKTLLVTVLCGAGHIAGSVLLGLIGVSLGLAVKKLQLFESVRGNFAAWLLIALGLMYLVWGLRKAYRNKPHEHGHTHASEAAHEHTHNHFLEHTHIHDDKAAVSVAPWALFVLFVFGPCEPLIPILMYPAAKNSLSSLVVVTGVFALTTIGTMAGAVLLCRIGFSFSVLEHLRRFADAIAGATICLCGLTIQLLGL